MILKGDLIFSRDNSLISKVIRLRTLSQWSHVGLCIGVINDRLLNMIVEKFLNDKKYIRINKKYVRVCKGDVGKKAVVSARWEGVVVDVFEDDWVKEGSVVQVLRPKVDNFEQIEKAIDFCINEIGKKYDFCGLVDFLFYEKFQSEKRWFCSELVFEAYKRAGFEILVRKEKEFVSPGDLYESPMLVLVG